MRFLVKRTLGDEIIWNRGGLQVGKPADRFYTKTRHYSLLWKINITFYFNKQYENYYSEEYIKEHFTR
jgi:hypothetical protein